MVCFETLTPNDHLRDKQRDSETGGASVSNETLADPASTDGTAETFESEEDDDDGVLKPFQREPGREYVTIHNDTYNMFFLSNVCGPCFFYSLYVFALKMALFTFLLLDAIKKGLPDPDDVDKTLLTAQFLILPVAVAMQDDLTATFFLIANIKYCESVKNDSPDASKWKFYVATLCRAIDGIYSLTVNFFILIMSDDVLAMFLNFAALQFLQTIDNIALDLAAAGYLSDRLERVALLVKKAELPKRGEDNPLRMYDSVFFIGTFLILAILWALFVTGHIGM